MLRNHLIHGYASNNKTVEYKTWVQMKVRCYNKNRSDYNNYGGRGIEVCERWRYSFELFLQDMGNRPSDKHSLDRYPNKNGNYEPSNCRWATALQQAQNKRNNHLIEYDGKALPISEWSRIFNIEASLIRYRLKKGFNPFVKIRKQHAA